MPGYTCSQLLGNSSGGKDWNDGTYSSVRDITVRANANTVTAIQFTYALYGTDSSVKDKLFKGTTHGGTDGTDKVLHLAPDEYLTKISGYHDFYNGVDVIKCLIFQTNKGILGAIGPQTGTYFETTGNGNIVGCYGKADRDFLYAIGVYKLA